MVSEDSEEVTTLSIQGFLNHLGYGHKIGPTSSLPRPFLLIVCTWDVVTAAPPPKGGEKILGDTPRTPLVVQDTQSSQQIAGFCNGLG